jgi:hypothetical protein
MKAYGIKSIVPSRMARKRMRREVFVTNKKASKIARKLRRLKQKSLEVEE